MRCILAPIISSLFILNGKGGHKKCTSALVERTHVRLVILFRMIRKRSKQNMSKSLATKNVAAVLLAVTMVFGVMFAFATPARAQTLESLQAQIQALLAQIAALQGGSSVPSASCTTFTRNHQQGQSGGVIMAIQKFLNSHGAQIAASGAGSPGNETSFFGGLTKAAVAKFQAANGISPAAGYWGPITRA